MLQSHYLKEQGVASSPGKLSSIVQPYSTRTYHGGERRELAIDARPNHLISYVIEIER